MINIENFRLPNYGVIQSRLPKELYDSLLKECLNNKNKKPMVSGLTQEGVAKHFYVSEKSMTQLTTFVEKMVDGYNEKYPPYLANLNFLDKNLPFLFTTPWINYQKKNEYVPLHKHDGIFSYNIWMKIPVESIFEFSYNSIIGTDLNYKLKLTKKDEGRIILFPSLLYHLVYPFYKSDQTRISIAGNILLKT
jgi:hypothetical protein